MRPTCFLLALLLVPAAATGAESRVDKAKALLAAKDCDQLLLGFENAKPSGTAADDQGLARVLADAAAGPCATDKIVAFSLGGAAARLSPNDVAVLVAAGNAARAAGQNGEAATLLDHAVTAAPTDPGPRISRAELALAESEPAAALKVLEPVKANPKAAKIYQDAQKASQASAAELKRLADAEKAGATAPPAKEPRTASGKAAHGKGVDDDDLPSGAGKVVGLSGGMSLGPPRTFKAKTKAGHNYRLKATGSCSPLHRVTGLDYRNSVPGADVRVRIGSFEHGLGTDRLHSTTDDFDFVAEGNNMTVEVSNSSSDTVCSLSNITITEH